MTNCFLIADETAKQAVLLDAPDHTTGPLLDEAAKRGWDVIGLWLTHGHFDHIHDAVPLAKRFSPQVVAIYETCEWLASKGVAKTAAMNKGGSQMAGPVKVTMTHAVHSCGIKEDDGRIVYGGEACGYVLHVAYYFPREQVLVGGDLIIGGSVGRTDLPDSNHRQLEASIRRVMELPAATRLLGGHGPATTLGEERQSNPFVQEALENR